MLTATAARSLRTVASRRALSTAAEPKLHKAKGNWDSLVAKRPVQKDDLHVVFEGNFNKGTVYFLTAMVVIGGWGSMEYGTWHQMYKQGYWK